MPSRPTRRGFLRAAAAAGGSLLTPGITDLARGAQSLRLVPGGGDAGGGFTGTAVNAPLAVVTQEISSDVNPRARSWVYLGEVLRRAGLFFEHLSPDQLVGSRNHGNRIVLLAGDLRLTTEQRRLLEDIVRGGGSLIGIGGVSGLEEVFGVNSHAPMAEGWIKVTARQHPVTAGLRSSLHVFGGCAVRVSTGSILAELESGNQAAKGCAIVENRCGEGRAVLLAPDLIFSIVHLQQGVSVLQDGKPAPDGSAPLNDGLLKAEDGLVLDWQRDRSPMEPDGAPAFIEPVSDELREMILRSVFHVAREQSVSLPVLWYWPRGLQAVGHISHDTDGNEPDKAVAMLEVMNRCRVKSTWCELYPGGYPHQFYRQLEEQGFEIALHYDAMTGGPRTSWSKDNFFFQYAWLLREAGLKRISTVKNHYTRWESRLDFFRWCEELGITADQTRGPSKKGTIGFPLGGSQPYFPLDDERDRPRFLPVLEVNMLTQDLVVVCPPEYGRQLTDAVLRHNGVAHFLFHPAHILKPQVGDTLTNLVDYGRSRGLEWWTCEQLSEWEMERRSVRATFESGNRVSLRAGRPLREAALLILKTRPEPRTLNVDGQAVLCKTQTWHGFDFDSIYLEAGSQVYNLRF